MLKDWSYELSATALENSAAKTATDQPDFTDAERTIDNDDNDLENITEDVIFNLSQELTPKKSRLSRKKKNDRGNEVIK